MKRFIAEQNIQNFMTALARETDPDRRAMLKRLIAEEQIKLQQARKTGREPS